MGQHFESRALEGGNATAKEAPVLPDPAGQRDDLDAGGFANALAADGHQRDDCLVEASRDGSCLDPVVHIACDLANYRRRASTALCASEETSGGYGSAAMSAAT